MLQWIGRVLGVQGEEKPEDSPQGKDAETKAKSTGGRKAPAPAPRYADVVVRYARAADRILTGGAEREHSVRVLFPPTGNKGMSRWTRFDADRFLSVQSRLPAGATHPATAAVLEAMQAIPDGHEVHPDRRLMVTGTSMAGLLGANRWLDREAAAAGLRSAEELLLARARGRVPGVRQNAHMERGKREEPEALVLLEKVTGLELVRDQRMGFLAHPSRHVGASPDGVLRRVPCLVEIKSKWRSTDAAVPEEHFYQMQTQMLATEREPGKGPLIRNVLYVQYVSCGASGSPVLSVRLVQYDPEVAATMLHAAQRYCQRLHASTISTTSVTPAARPATATATAPKSKRKKAARAVRRVRRRVL